MYYRQITLNYLVFTDSLVHMGIIVKSDRFFFFGVNYFTLLSQSSSSKTKQRRRRRRRPRQGQFFHRSKGHGNECWIEENSQCAFSPDFFSPTILKRPENFVKFVCRIEIIGNKQKIDKSLC